MVWNTIAHPKMMIDSNHGGLGDASTMKNRPLLSVDTAKQSFYDFILNLQVVGYEAPTIDKDGNTPPNPIVKPILVHGDYQDIYNKLMNAQLVIGALVSLLSPDASTFGQVGSVTPPLLNITKVFINNLTDINGRRPTVGGMPLIIIEVGNMPDAQLVSLDCLNRVYDGDDTIPYDT